MEGCYYCGHAAADARAERDAARNALHSAHARLAKAVTLLQDLVGDYSPGTVMREAIHDFLEEK